MGEGITKIGDAESGDLLTKEANKTDIV